MMKYMMFEDMKADKVMYPIGKIKTRDEVIEDYPIFGTGLGVIGVDVDENGNIGDIARMGYFDNIEKFVSFYKEQGVEFTEGMTNAEKCEAITAFVNQPKATE